MGTRALFSTKIVPPIFAGGASVFQISTRAGLPQARAAQSGSLAGKQVQQAATFFVFQNTNNLVFKWANYSVNSAPSLLDAGEFSFTVKAAVKYGGVTYPISFDDGRTKTVPVDGLVESLPLSLPILANTSFELRWLIDFSTAPTNWPLTTRYNTDGWNQFGNALTDVVDLTTVFFVRQTNYMVLPPYQIIGSGVNKKAFEIMGDSISSDGSNDAFTYNSGWPQRGLSSAGIPFVNNGASGNSLVTQISGATAAQRARRKITRNSRAITHVICGLATNDFTSGRTDTQILADLATLKSELDLLGIKLIPTTCCPRTDATNTAKNGSDSVNVWTYRRNLNTAIRNNNGVGYGYFDVALHTQDTSNIDLWRTDLGTPTADGIHPNSVLHTELATQFQTFLSTI